MRIKIKTQSEYVRTPKMYTKMGDIVSVSRKGETYSRLSFNVNVSRGNSFLPD